MTSHTGETNSIWVLGVSVDVTLLCPALWTCSWLKCDSEFLIQFIVFVILFCIQIIYMYNVYNESKYLVSYGNVDRQINMEHPYIQQLRCDPSRSLCLITGVVYLPTGGTIHRVTDADIEASGKVSVSTYLPEEPSTASLMQISRLLEKSL